MPVTVAGAGTVLRWPLVSCWSVAEAGITLVVVLPGRLPSGLAAETGTASVGALRPLAMTGPLVKLPKYQSKPRAGLMSCSTSMNRALM